MTTCVLEKNGKTTMRDRAFHLLLGLSLLVSIGKTGYSQKKVSEADTITQMETVIRGSWVRQNTSASKLVFDARNHVKHYEEGELIFAENYKITRSCNGETAKDAYFLKTFPEGDEDNPSCVYIERINGKANGILSLMTANQGKIIVYERP